MDTVFAPQDADDELKARIDEISVKLDRLLEKIDRILSIDEMRETIELWSIDDR